MSDFNYGDKVTHPVYGDGKVANTYPEQNLVQVFFEGRGLKQEMLHPKSLTLIPDPWRPVSIKWNSGESTRTRVRQSEMVQYIKDLPIERIDSLDFGTAE
jgi:hypothetical protein